jgi:hypothetical protein
LNLRRAGGKEEGNKQGAAKKNGEFHGSLTLPEAGKLNRFFERNGAIR